MKYAKIKYNDTINCLDGICVSLWTVGCPHRCEGCHNANLWDYEAGVEVPSDIRGQIIKAISANGVQRQFSVLGGEPLCAENREFVNDIVKTVRVAYPNIKIYLWTGYTMDELKGKDNDTINNILSNIDVLIDGRFILSERDITLPLRGSRNQRVWRKLNGEFTYDI